MEIKISQEDQIARRNQDAFHEGGKFFEKYVQSKTIFVDGGGRYITIMCILVLAITNDISIYSNDVNVERGGILAWMHDLRSTPTPPPFLSCLARC